MSRDQHPHKWIYFQGISFPDDGHYDEILNLSAEYVDTEGSTGAVRDIFTGSGAYERVITHMEASGTTCSAPRIAVEF